MGYQIAIDGPAGAGKSTIAKRIAAEKGFVYVDTGAMYRGLAVHFLKRGINTADEDKIAAACHDAEITIGYEAGGQQIYLNGTNITDQLRGEEVGKMASRSSALPSVREKLLKLQRELARTDDVVMDGRDIGTYVLPDADVKIFLTASVKTRAKRRYNELIEKGLTDVSYAEIENDIIERDQHDMNRRISPLKQAEDAVRIDSSEMSKEEVVTAILGLCR